MSADTKNKSEKAVLGWREWVSLPELGIDWIKAKVDTGARTSALHAFALDTFTENGVEVVEFRLHPIQRDNETEIVCRAPVVDRRIVSDSGGHREERLVIETPVRVGAAVWPIEITLTGRDNMLFRMLLGRTAIRRRALVDSGRSFLTGRPPEQAN